MEEINKQYREICVTLGDVEVKLKGLQNQKDAIFKQLEELDKQAAAIIAKQQEDQFADKETGETRGI